MRRDLYPLVLLFGVIGLDFPDAVLEPVALDDARIRAKLLAEATSLDTYMRYAGQHQTFDKTATSRLEL